MTVTAKMYCTKKTESAYSPYGSNHTQPVSGVEVVLQPVYDPQGSNKSWSEATPSGEVRLYITNPAAYDQFKIGQCYLVHFTPTEP